MALTKATLIDLNSNELALDLDGDTTLHSSTDDQIDIKIAGADDFTFTANAFNALAGSHITLVDNSQLKVGADTDLQIYHDGTNSYIANKTGALKIATETSGIAITIGHTTSEVTIADNVTVTGNINVGGTLTFVDGSIAIADLDIDGGTDIGAAIVDADLFIVDDGAGGTNRKTAASRLLTYAMAGTLSEAAQTNITSLGTLTALTVDDVAVDAKSITMTGSSSDTAVITAGTNGTLSIVTTDAAAAAANIQITADGTFEVDATTITLDSAGDIILDADGGDVFVKDAGTTFGSLTNTSGNLIIKSGTTTAATFSGANVTFAGTVGSGAITSTGIVTGTAFTAGSAVLAEAELELLDGLTAGTAIASKVVTTDANIDTTGQRNLTISGEIDAATGDFSGAVDVAGATTVVALTASGLVTAGAKIDMNGTELILDADADTSITADTDDQIDIRIAGADDFTFTANDFTALSGSVISTDNINETTSGSGVTIDGVLLKDGNITMSGLAAGSGITLDLAGSTDYIIEESSTDDIIEFGQGLGGRFSHNISSGALTIRGASTITTADNSATLTLVSTDNDTAEGPILAFDRSVSDVAAGDLIGTIKFLGEDDAGNAALYHEIQASIEDGSNGGEDGRLTIYQSIAGATKNVLDFKSGEIVFNQDSVDLDFRIESNGDANMLFVNGGTDRIGIKTNAPTKTLGIGGDGLVSLEGSSNALTFYDSSALKAYITSQSFGDHNGDGLGLVTAGDEPIKFFANGALQWTIETTGHLIPGGNDHGIHLGVSSATASNLLDDYEEGTWTIILEDNSDNAITLSTNAGTYIKIGGQVTVTGYLVASALESASGGIRISGLPFNILGNSRNYAAMSVGYAVGLNITAGTSIAGIGIINTNNVNIVNFDATAGSTNLTAAKFSADGGFVFTMTYTVV